MKQKIAPLDDILLRMKQVDRALISGDIYDAMRSAVELHPLHKVLSAHKETPAQERCSLLLQGYMKFLQDLGVKDPISQAYRDFATEVGHNPSSGTNDSTRHYRTWRSVLNQYQEQYALPVVSWFK